ncbi:MAG TPA: toll/interleukin-1 receptor domain-containing protein [Thermoanaerobaculia bacterium]|nr:toll/interleukin-1 receptor domain-containing protein [Thermoanaerobaculia bacterium]
MTSVFISYAHTRAEQRFARNLDAALRRAGLDVWRDERELSKLSRYHDAIVAAASRCDAAIFLVSRDWLKRDWTKYELGIVSRRRRKGQKVEAFPIYRASFDRLLPKLPPAFIEYGEFEWFAGVKDGLDDAARFWHVLCAINGGKPGDRAEWSAQGRAFYTGADHDAAEAVLPEPKELPPATVDAPALDCGRAGEWHTAEIRYRDPRHELIVVSAPHEEAHEQFSQRIKKHLAIPSSAHWFKVDWSRPLAGDHDYLGRIIETIDPDRSQNVIDPYATLGELLDDLLGENTVVLEHPTVSGRSEDPKLYLYYTDWLPNIVAKIRSPYPLKCVQPVAWNRRSRVITKLRGIGTWLKLANAGSWFGKADEVTALNFIKKVSTERGALPAVKDIPLSEITAADVEQYCGDALLEEDERDQLVFRTQRGPTMETSSDILKEINRFMLCDRIHADARRDDQ